MDVVAIDDDRFELLILSEAGKPVYSFTKREDVVTLMPLCSALVNYAEKTQGESLHSIKTSDNLIINFSKRPPLIIIVVHDARSYVDVQVLVEQVEAQVISILTAKTLKSVFADRPTFDLKRLLYGSEKLIDATVNLSSFSLKLDWPWVESFLPVTFPSTHTTSGPQISSQPPPSRPHRVLIPITVMPPNTRDNLHNVINGVVSSCSKNMVFSLLFRIGPRSCDYGDDTSSNDEGSANGDGSIDGESNSDANKHRLIVLCNHHDRHKMKTADMHLVLALLYGSRAQLSSADSLWMPICLPKFNQDAFVHSYIAYINNSRHCLVLMSIDRDEFGICQEARKQIEDKINTIMKDASMRNKIDFKLSPLVHPVLLQLQNKLMSRNLTADELASIQQKTQIYNSKTELYHARQLQFFWYQTSKQVLWWQRSDIYGPNSVIYYMMERMLCSSLKHLWLKKGNVVFLGWYLPAFQIYAQFDSTITANEATEVIQRITNWIKKEEDNLSIKDYR